MLSSALATQRLQTDAGVKCAPSRRRKTFLEQVVEARGVAKAAAKGLPPVATAEEERRGDLKEPKFALF